MVTSNKCAMCFLIFFFCSIVKAWESTGREQKCSCGKAKSGAQNDGWDQWCQTRSSSPKGVEGGSWMWAQQAQICRGGAGAGICKL